MKRAVVLIVLVMLALGSFIAADEKRAEVLFQAAMAKETVEGNLQGAIALYESVVSEAGASRALAARALLRMAECHQKLGDARARQIFEQVVRDYGDQTAAVAEAQAHLVSLSPAADASGMVFRKLWPDQKSSYEVAEGSVSPDGRYISYPDYATGNLMVHDLVTGRDRPLTNTGYTAAPGDTAQLSAISRDGKNVAYGWDNGAANRYELRVVSLQSDGFPPPRTLFHHDDVGFLVPFDWSPDGKWVAVWLQRKDRTSQLGLVSTLDGSLRVLKSVDWRGPTRMSFSPDGRYLAFDLRTSDSDANERDVFVLTVDASGEFHVVDSPGHDRLMGWSPDGTRLLFASDRTGTLGLWGLPIAAGRSQGTPALIKPDIPAASIGVTASGALFTVSLIGGGDIKMASLDLETGKLLKAPISAMRLVGSSRTPDWSPDGKFLAYLADRDRALVVVIRAVDTGELREVPVDLDYIGVLRWASDSRSFVGKGNSKGRAGVYRIDASTGKSTPLHITPATGLSMAQLSPDGEKLYYWGGPGDILRGNEGAVFLERDLASGHERELFRGPGPAFPELSPDGRFLAGTSYDDRSKSSTLILIPVMGGQPKELLRLNDPQRFDRWGYVTWTPDGRSVIVPLHGDESRAASVSHDLMLIPIDGRAPRKLELDTRNLNRGGVRVHPDGRQIAFSTGGGRRSEVWVLENFLPTPGAAK